MKYEQDFSDMDGMYPDDHHDIIVKSEQVDNGSDFSDTEGRLV